MRIKLLHPNAKKPIRATQGSAGFDLFACESVTIHPGHRVMVKIGVALELPCQWEAQIRPRSGLARHRGVTVLNNPATIDDDYRGEIEVNLINHGNVSLTIEVGDRVAQMVFAKVEWPQLDVTDAALTETERGSSGHGSTGR
jgi:dUTP pyrophosphatase